VWNVSYSEVDFDNINQLATASDWRLVFDLNVLLRDRDNRWNSSNAHELLRYAVKKKYDRNMDLELGNGKQLLLALKFKFILRYF